MKLKQRREPDNTLRRGIVCEGKYICVSRLWSVKDESREESFWSWFQELSQRMEVEEQEKNQTHNHFLRLRLRAGRTIVINDYDMDFIRAQTAMDNF